MKVYSISSIETLERAADIAKWQNHRAKLMNYIDYCKRRLITDPDNPIPPVTLELGRQAQLFRHDGERKQLLATLYVKGARDFAREELKEE